MFPAKVISIDSIETEDINFGDDNHEIKKNLYRKNNIKV